MKRFLSCGAFLCLFICEFASAVIIGSNTAPSREKTSYFPAADTNNMMLGFAAFANGTYFEDSTTSCIFNSYYPLSGPLLLNGGTLNLYQKFSPDAKTIHINAGTINGAGLAITYPAAATTSSFPVFGALTNTCFQKDNTLSAAANCTSLDVNYDDTFLATGLETSVSSELVIYALSNDTPPAPISLSPAGGKMGSTINCLRWHPDQNYLAVCCSNNQSGKEIRIYKKTPSSFLKMSEIEIGADALACAWHPDGNYLIVGTNNPNNVLISYSFNQVTGTLTKEAITTIPNVTSISRKGLSFSPDGSYLAVGIPKTTGASELMVFFFAAGSLELVASQKLSAKAESVSFDPTGIFIATALSGVTTKPVRIYKFDSTHNTLILQTSSIENRSAYDAHWDPTGTFVAACYAGGAVGSAASLGIVQVYAYIHDLPIPAGYLPQPTLIPFFYSMTKTTPANHSTIRWQNDASHFFSADIGKKIEAYTMQKKPIVFQDCVIEVANDFNVLTPIEFVGNVRLCGTKGVQARLFMQPESRLIVRPGSTLSVENFHIEDCANSNIFCMDDTASVVLKNSLLCLTGAYTFSYGSLTIEEKSEIHSDTAYQTFFYTSPKPLTIIEDAQLTIGEKTIFNYQPSNAQNNLIELEEKSSILYFDNNTTLSITSTEGLLLTKGQVICNGNVAINTDLQEEEGDVLEKGICFGTGIEADNCSFTIMPLASVIVNGYFIDNNTATEDFTLGKYSTFQLDPGAYFKTYISLVNPFGEFRKSVDATITLTNGATITPDPTEF